MTTYGIADYEALLLSLKKNKHITKLVACFN